MTDTKESKVDRQHQQRHKPDHTSYLHLYQPVVQIRHKGIGKLLKNIRRFLRLGIAVIISVTVTPVRTTLLIEVTLLVGAALLIGTALLVSITLLIDIALLVTASLLIGISLLVTTALLIGISLLVCITLLVAASLLIDLIIHISSLLHSFLIRVFRSHLQHLPSADSLGKAHLFLYLP